MRKSVSCRFSEGIRRTMKLPNFLRYERLTELRNKMGAELVSWSSMRRWSQFDPDEWRRLQSLGIEVPLEDVVPADDGTLEYRGQKVVLYIRDQRISMKYKGTPGGGYRYHVADCHTLKKMREHGRYERYVVSTRKDGKFVVNTFNYDQIVEKDVEKEIPVCKNCLKELNYKGYGSAATSEKKDQTWKGFNLIEYFNKYSTKIWTFPKHSEHTAPLNTYSDDWDEVSTRYRRTLNWRCEQCGTELIAHKTYLHVHHKNGVQSDNRRENLEALCIKCHAEKPNHQQLRKAPDYASYLAFNL